MVRTIVNFIRLTSQKSFVPATRTPNEKPNIKEVTRAKSTGTSARRIRTNRHFRMVFIDAALLSKPNFYNASQSRSKAHVFVGPDGPIVPDEGVAASED